MRPDRIPFAVLDARDRALTVACGLASFSPSLVPFEPEPTVGGAKRACVARGSSSSASRHRIRARALGYPVVRIGRQHPLRIRWFIRPQDTGGIGLAFT